MMINTLILGFLVLVFWRLLQRLFFRTVLDNVPGPSPVSFWEGERHKVVQFYYLIYLLTHHEHKDPYPICRIPEHGIFIRN